MGMKRMCHGGTGHLPGFQRVSHDLEVDPILIMTLAIDGHRLAAERLARHVHRADSSVRLERANEISGRQEFRSLVILMAGL